MEFEADEAIAGGRVVASHDVDDFLDDLQTALEVTMT